MYISFKYTACFIGIIAKYQPKHFKGCKIHSKWEYESK